MTDEQRAELFKKAARSVSIFVWNDNLKYGHRPTNPLFSNACMTYVGVAGMYEGKHEALRVELQKPGLP